MASIERSMQRAARRSAIELTRYQQRWVLDKSRFKIGSISRQGGKSFGTSLEAVDDVMEHELQGARTKWVFLSAGERQSKELISAAAMHSRAYNLAARELESEFRAEDDEKYKQLEISYPNGSRIIGLPANPATARGHSANILLDEFAFHKDSRAIWKALFPTVTRGYKIRIISTFQGRTNKFYELFFSAPTLQSFNGEDHVYKGERGGWSKHLINIHQAVEMGLQLRDDEGNPCDPEDLRLALNDEDAWTEEYECVPNDEAHAFLSHDLISTVEDPRLVARPGWVDALLEEAYSQYETYRSSGLVLPLPLSHLNRFDVLGDLYIGFDIGRKKDLSAIWIDQDVAGFLKTLAVIELKRTPFFVQDLVLHTLMKHPRFRRARIDETGLGAQLAESALDRFGAHRVEPITFTTANKEALAEGLKKNFEDRKSGIPADATIRRSLHAVKRFATSTGHFRFDAERTDETGHSDHFWSKALATTAADQPRAIIDFETTGQYCEHTRMSNF